MRITQATLHKSFDCVSLMAVHCNDLCRVLPYFDNPCNDSFHASFTCKASITAGHLKMAAMYLTRLGDKKNTEKNKVNKKKGMVHNEEQETGASHNTSNDRNRE